MREERLLERIRRWEKTPQSRDREDPKKAIDSVVRHLQRLLNTHQGSVQVADDYGLPDIMHVLQQGPDAALDLENAIRDVIEKYEPRITGVRVRLAPSDDGKFSLTFNVQGKLRSDAQPVAFETVVGSNGKVQVKN